MLKNYSIIERGQRKPVFTVTPVQQKEKRFGASKIFKDKTPPSFVHSVILLFSKEQLHDAGIGMQAILLALSSLSKPDCSWLKIALCYITQGL